MNPEARKTAQENLESKNNSTTPQAEKGAEKIPDFNQRITVKAEMLENARRSYESGDTSSISPEEQENLRTKLPGMMRVIKGRIEYIKNDSNTANQAENNKKIENLQRLLAASESMQQYFDSQNPQEAEAETATPEQATTDSQNLPPAEELPQTPEQVTSIIDRNDITSEEDRGSQEEDSSEKRASENQGGSEQIQNQAESSRNTADSAREKLEKFKNVEEIMNELVKKTEKLNELLSEIEKSEEGIDKKEELETEIQKILKDIEDLLEQLKEQPDDLNPEDTEKIDQLDSEITRLQEEINENPNSSEAQSKKEQLVKLSAEYKSYQNSRLDSFNTAQEIVSTFSLIKQKEKGKLNDALKSRVDEVMTNSGTNFGEKFKNIEKNHRQSNVQ